MKRASEAFFNHCIQTICHIPYSGESDRFARSVVLEFEDGCIAFERISPQVYSAHWCFLPKAKDVVGKGRDALAYLFANTDALRVVGKTPLTLKAAIRAARKVGMRHLFDCSGWSFTELTRAQFHGRD